MVNVYYYINSEAAKHIYNLAIIYIHSSTPDEPRNSTTKQMLN